MFERCLICTDFSDGLYRFTEFVSSLAAAGIKKLVFVHSVPIWDEGGIPRVDEEAIASSRQRLQQLIKNIPQGIEVKVEVPSGRPLDTIPKIAKAEKADLIIIGTPPQSILQERLFGSTATALLKACVTPILILRPQLISTYTCEELDLRSQHLFRCLLLPYNGSNASHYLLQRIKEYAQKRSENTLKQCVLMWVVDDGGRREIPKDYQLQDAQKQLNKVKSELEELGLEVQAEVRLGNPYEQILEAALVNDISAIAIASEHIRNIIDFPVRSFAGELMRRSWHPILFFPTQHS
jgi:nucleotide-binding universal stress UspA family protein